MDMATAFTDERKLLKEFLKKKGKSDIIDSITISEKPETWFKNQADGAPNSKLALTPCFLHRLLDGVEFLGFRDPSAADQWSAIGSRVNWLALLDIFSFDNDWSINRLSTVKAIKNHSDIIIQYIEPTQCSVLKNLASKNISYFDFEFESDCSNKELLELSLIVAATSDYKSIDSLLSKDYQSDLCRVNMSSNQWSNFGAPLFGKTQFQYSHAVVFPKKDQYDICGAHRDVLDDWVMVLKGEIELLVCDFEKSGEEQFGPIMSTQYMLQNTSLGNYKKIAISLNLYAGQCVIIPHGYLKLFRSLTDDTVVVRHFWRY